MRNKFVALAFALFLFAAGTSTGYGAPQPQRSPADQEKIEALNEAYRNGLLTQAEYDAKLKELNSGSHAPAPGKVNISSRTRTVEIQDPAWGIAAARFEIPADWNFEGILIRDEGCDFAPTFAWRMTSPDGLYGAMFMPEFGSHWSDDPTFLQPFRRFQCKIMEPMDAEEFMKYILPFVRPNPTLGPIEPTVDAQQWQQFIDHFNQNNNTVPAPAHQTGAAIRSRIQYVYRGQTFEENFAVRLRTTQRKIGFYAGRTHFSWQTFAHVTTVRAPKGQLDEVMRTLVAATFKRGAPDFTPEWEQRQRQQRQEDMARALAMQQQQAAANQAIYNQNQATFNQNHEAFMKSQNDSFARSEQRNRESMAALDASAKAYTLYAGDQQLVRNPQTGAVSTVTNKYGTNAWQENNSNQIRLYSDPNINPNLYQRSTWTQLENVNPLNPHQ